MGKKCSFLPLIIIIFTSQVLIMNQTLAQKINKLCATFFPESRVHSLWKENRGCMNYSDPKWIGMSAHSVLQVFVCSKKSKYGISSRRQKFISLLVSAAFSVFLNILFGPTKNLQMGLSRNPDPCKVLQIIRTSPIFFPQCRNRNASSERVLLHCQRSFSLYFVDSTYSG